MGLFIVTISYLVQKNIVFSSFTKTMIDREKARQLAYSGIHLAMSQLAMASEQEKKEEQSKEQGKPVATCSDGKQFIKTMYTILNTWQDFSLKRSIDGIDGKISIAIGCEDGKINLNSVYDFKEHKFVGEGKAEGDMKKIMQLIFAQLKEQTNVDMFDEFEKFMKEREYPLNDVTELLLIKNFDWFKDKLFYEPSREKKTAPLYLTDLFTIWTNQPGFDLWLLSPSLQQLFGFKKPDTINTEELLKLFKDSISLPQDGINIVKALYNADYNKIAKTISPLIRTTFEPKVFSVVSYGTIGAVTVRLLALVERVKKESKEATGYTLSIRKIYSI